MGSELELRWIELPAGELKPARRFLDFVVDGESLFDRVGGDDDISCLGWLAADEDELAARRLLGRSEPDVEDRVALWVCSSRGDVMCGALTARVATSGDEVIWHDFASSYPDHAFATWVHEAGSFAGWEAIRFNVSTYTEVIEQRPPTVSQFAGERSGGVVQAIRRRLLPRAR